MEVEVEVEEGVEVEVRGGWLESIAMPCPKSPHTGVPREGGRMFFLHNERTRNVLFCHKKTFTSQGEVSAAISSDTERGRYCEVSPHVTPLWAES